MDTDDVGELVEGKNRMTLSGHNHNISWGFSSFPIEGSINVRVRFIEPETCDRADGGTRKDDGALGVYTGTGTQVLATNVLPGTCYRLIWRPNNSATANKKLPGTLALGDT